MSRRSVERAAHGVAFACVLVGLVAVVYLGWALVTGTPVAPPGSQPAAAAASAPSPAAPAEPLPGGWPGDDAPAEEQPSTGGGGPRTAARAAVLPPLPGQPLRVQVPAVGLDLRVYAARLPGNRVFDPPSVPNAYWMMDYGRGGRATDNTVYIAGHSSNVIPAAFNPLLDISHEGSAVVAGQKVLLTTPEGLSTYTITAYERYDKDTVLEASELWKAVPGRLALVTCFQHDHRALSTQNFVVYAELDPPR